MESHLCAPADFIDDLLDFASDFGDGGDGDDFKASAKTLTLPSPNTLQGIVEEDLEWITNKDAFPMVESFVDMIADHNNRPSKAKNQESPVSVLENSSTGIPAMLTLPCSLKVPVRARSNIRKRRREIFGGMQWQCWVKETRKPGRKKVQGETMGNGIMGRKCQHCQTEKTPQWRTGPMGPKTLCNACGVRYKSGRLVPEYRPASSPTFSSEVHSNSHRKIIEMRRQMQTAGSPRVGLR